MMEDDQNSRRTRRTRRSARASGVGSVSDSSVAHSDGNINDVVEQSVAPPPLPMQPEALSSADALAGSPRNEEFTPRNRMEEVSSRATSYEREYRLKLIHRMLMRNVPLDEIAKELDISVRTVQRDREELFDLLKQGAKKLDINLIVGDTVGFYKEVVAMSLRAASNTKAPMQIRLAAMRTSLASQNDMHRFMVSSGVYDVLRYKKAEDKAGNDISKLMRLTNAILDGDGATEELPENLVELDEMEAHII